MLKVSVNIVRTEIIVVVVTIFYIFILIQTLDLNVQLNNKYTHRYTQNLKYT